MTAKPAAAPNAPPPRKRQPAATAGSPTPVVAPAPPADQVFGNLIIAQRDTATVMEQALRSQLAAREGQYERDMARLQAEFKADQGSLRDQINTQELIIEAADAALATLSGGNVVPLRPAVEMAA